MTNFDAKKVKSSEPHKIQSKSPASTDLGVSISSAHYVLQLQQTFGNQKTQQVLRHRKGSTSSIQRRLNGTAAALSFISEGTSGFMRKDAWKKLVEAVRDYETLEQKQPTGGNFKSMKSGFENMLAKLDAIWELTNEWMRDNAEIAIGKRAAYEQSEFPKIQNNTSIEKSNKAAVAHNQLHPGGPQLPIEPMQAVAPESTESQQMGTIRMLLARLTLEKEAVRSALANPVGGKWLQQSNIFSDKTLQNSNDNAVGGAMNKLDAAQWQQEGGKTQTGFFIKDKSIDANIAGTGAAPIGIPSADPNYGARAIAMGRIDNLITDKIGEMSRFVDPGNSKMLVNMQFAVHERETTRNSGQREVKMGIMSERAQGAEFRSGFIENSNASIDAAQKQAEGPASAGKIAMDDPQLQRGLNKLQLLDAICGQVDRHLGNIYVQADAQGGVQSVKGIDNDMAFGRNQTDLQNSEMKLRLKNFAWRGLPPIADYETAIAIQNIPEELLREAITGLLAPAEIEATISRFRQVKQFLASLPQDALIKRADWIAQRQQLAIRQTSENSYLGSARNEMVKKWFDTNAVQTRQTVQQILTDQTRLPADRNQIGFGAQQVINTLMGLVTASRITIAQIPATATKFAVALAIEIRRDNDATNRTIIDFLDRQVP